MPVTEHSAQILVGSWPSQSVMAWAGYAMAFKQQAHLLSDQLDTQMDIKESLAGMDGYLIDKLLLLTRGRETALQNRIAAYLHISNKARWAANELQATKTELTDIVNAAEEKIRVSRENAEKAKQASAGVPGAVAAIESQLQTAITGLVANAKREAQARDLQGATTVTALSNDISQWASPYTNMPFPESELGSAPVPSSPGALAPSQNGSGTMSPVDHSTFKESPLDRQSQPEQSAPRQEQSIQQTAMRTPDKADPGDVARPEKSQSPLSSAPSSPASSGGSSSGGGNSASSLGQMMRPASSGSSSSGGSSPASSSGSASPANAAQSGQMANAKPGGIPAAGAGTGAGAGAGAGGRALGLASLGSGIAESSARLASGAVNTATNMAAGAASVGGNVAPNVAQAAAAAASAPVTSPPPAAGGGAPMGMMPAGAAAAGGGSAVVNPVTSSPAPGAGGSANVGGGPPSSSSGSGPSPASAAGSGGVASQAAGSGSVAPVAVQSPGVRGVGVGGASGDLLYQQAMDAAGDVVSAMVAQSVGSGYIEIHYAAALVYERGGSVSAWLATSEGASYIPLGVRVPHDVRLSVTDPVVGRELWEKSAAAGGANPLEIVVRQAEARDMASPGGRVLAVASSLPMDQVIDWAGEVGARPVSVDPKAIAAAPDAGVLHRCAVAMPWEWRQANAFSEQERFRVASRHMYMAVSAGLLSGSGACEQVMEQFELRQPIDDALWRDVDRARFMSLIEYEMAMRSAGQGGAEPARALAAARAAEVVLCLRNYSTAEGCADLLYASRLAGAPLNPAAAVA